MEKIEPNINSIFPLKDYEIISKKENITIKYKISNGHGLMKFNIPGIKSNIFKEAAKTSKTAKEFSDYIEENL